MTLTSSARLVGRSSAGRELYLAVSSALGDWPSEIELRPGFVLLTVLDTQESSDDELRGFAGKLLDQGCGYACSWGPGANRVHLAFDLEFIEREQRGALPVGFVLTSDLDESLDEALWYSLFVAWPADVDAEGLLVVCEPRWAARVEERLIDTETLSHDVLRDEQ